MSGRWAKLRSVKIQKNTIGLYFAFPNGSLTADYRGVSTGPYRTIDEAKAAARTMRERDKAAQ